MPDLPPLDLDGLSRIYLISNTPRFLYRRFRENASVQWLAKEWPAERLLEVVADVGTRAERDVVALAMAYAALVAVTLQPQLTASTALQQWQGGHLQWDRDIVAIHLEESVSTHVAHFDAVRPTAIAAVSSASTQSTLLVVNK